MKEKISELIPLLITEFILIVVVLSAIWTLKRELIQKPLEFIKENRYAIATMILFIGMYFVLIGFEQFINEGH